MKMYNILREFDVVHSFTRYLWFFNFWWWKILQFAYYLDVETHAWSMQCSSQFWCSFLIFYLPCIVNSTQCTLNSFKYGHIFIRKHLNLLLSISNWNDLKHGTKIQLPQMICVSNEEHKEIGLKVDWTRID